MTLITDSVPNFIGGVSQQTDKLIYPTQSKELINFLPDPIEGLKKRPPLQHIARLSDTTTIHPLIKTVIQENAEYIVMLTGTGVKVYDLEGEEQEVYINSSSSSYIQSSDPLTELAVSTIADYTFITNKTVTTALTDDTYENDYENCAIVFVKQGDYNIDYIIEINGSTAASYTTPKSTEDDPDISTTAIAEELYSDLSSNLSSSQYTLTLQGSTILIESTKSFTITTADGNGDNNLFAFYNETSCLNDLPVTAPNGFILKIIGDDQSVADDYYVKFQTSDGSDFSQGSWVECPQPGIQYKIDSSTMPHALILEEDGTFTLDVIDWTERKAGDEDTAPTPSFIGNTIQEVLTYKGRLGFISVDRSCYSDVEDIFSFFKRSVLTELDTDPIDVASNSQMVLLRHSMPFNEGLLLLSETAQFTLKGGDVFSNSTVSLDLTTQYQCSELCKPVSLGASGYFAFENGSYTRIMYLYVNSSYVVDAIDVTEQVPAFISGNCYKLLGSTANNVLMALTRDELDTIYVYNFYNNGEQRVQSAWHKWTFDHTQILNADFDKHTIYLVMQYSDGIYLEKIDMSPKLKEDTVDYLFYMDRKIYQTDIDDYDEETDITTVQLPYDVMDTDTFTVIDTLGFPKVWTADEDDTSIIYVSGQETSLVMGNIYTSYWVMPKIYIRQQTATGAQKVREGNLMLRDINLSYADSGYFLVDVIQKYTTQISSSFKFTGMIMGMDTAVLGTIPVESGTFLIPVIAKNEEIDIAVTNDSYLPCCFVSMEWIGDFTIRGNLKQ